MPSSRVEASKIIKLVTDISEASKRAKKEEDLKSEFEYLLRRFTETEKWGFTFHPKHEVTVVGGSIDAVFRRLVIEYKKPDTLRDSNDAKPNQKALIQIKEKYLPSLIERENRNLHKLGLQNNFPLFSSVQRRLWRGTYYPSRYSLQVSQ